MASCLKTGLELSCDCLLETVEGGSIKPAWFILTRKLIFNAVCARASPCFVPCRSGHLWLCAVFMWHQATYSYQKTRLCEIAKDMGILDLQLHSNQRMRGRNQRRGWTGLSRWINRTAQPRRERLPGALMEDLSDYPTLVVFWALPFFYYILPLNRSNISQTPLFI